MDREALKTRISNQCPNFTMRSSRQPLRLYPFLSGCGTLAKQLAHA